MMSNVIPKQALSEPSLGVEETSLAVEKISLEDCGIESRTTEQGTLYLLPQREPQRPAGVFLIVFGSLFGGIPGVMLVKGVVELFQGTSGIFELFFSLFTLPFVLMGLALVVLGQALFGSRAQFEVTGDELRVREHAGLLRWSSRRPLSAWKRVVAGTGSRRRGGQGNASKLIERSLRVEFDGLKPLLIAPGYPDRTTRVLAKELARIGAAAGATAELVLPPPVTEPEKAEEDEADALVELSPDTDLEVERRGAALLVHVPPRGVRKGSRGLVFMGLFFFGIVALFATFSVVVPAMKGGFGSEQVPFLLFSMLFGTVGAALLLGGINMGRRKATLAATTEKLVIERISLFGTKRTEWLRDELVSVRIGPSGMAVNDVPIQELQVQERGGKKTGLLSQRDDPEIRWIARELRRALDL